MLTDGPLPHSLHGTLFLKDWSEGSGLTCHTHSQTGLALRGSPRDIFGSLTKWVSLCGLEFASPASQGPGLHTSANTTLLLDHVLSGFFFNF